MLCRQSSDVSSGSTTASDLGTPDSETGVLEMAQQQAYPRKRCRAGDFARCSYSEQPLKKSGGRQQQNLAQHLRPHLTRISQGLKLLQPKCTIDSEIVENGIAVFQGYVQAVHEQMNNGYAAPKIGWLELAAACFWIATKADGSRACLPSRALLSRACQVPPAALSDIELTVLVTLDWEVFAVLRRANSGAATPTVLPAGEAERY